MHTSCSSFVEYLLYFNLFHTLPRTQCQDLIQCTLQPISNCMAESSPILLFNPFISVSDQSVTILKRVLEIGMIRFAFLKHFGERKCMHITILMGKMYPRHHFPFHQVIVKCYSIGQVCKFCTYIVLLYLFV